jgi:hypothetical protein
MWDAGISRARSIGRARRTRGGPLRRWQLAVLAIVRADPVAATRSAARGRRCGGGTSAAAGVGRGGRGRAADPGRGAARALARSAARAACHRSRAIGCASSTAASRELGWRADACPRGLVGADALVVRGRSAAPRRDGARTRGRDRAAVGRRRSVGERSRSHRRGDHRALAARARARTRAGHERGAQRSGPLGAGPRRRGIRKLGRGLGGRKLACGA